MTITNRKRSLNITQSYRAQITLVFNVQMRQGCASGVPNLSSPATYLTIMRCIELRPCYIRQKSQKSAEMSNEICVFMIV